MRKTFMMFAVATLALTACVPKADLEKQLEQVKLISAEKDSLLKDVMTTSQFIADISGELARLNTVPAPEQSAAL
jgi:hypothetical protein